jgi:simple sugar transport system substrate-binding protein
LLALGGDEGEYASAALREEIVTILIKLAIAAGLATALTSTALAADLVVGFSQIGSESGWRAAETSVTKLEAEKRGIDLKFADAQQKQENQIKAIRGFIAQGVDAILVAPVVATGWEDVLGEAKEANIPVILLDRGVDAPQDLYLTSVASDQVKEGQVAGQWLVDTVKDKDCKIVELQGTVGSTPAINRKKGFEQAIAGRANISIIRSQTGDFTRAKGKEVMEGFIKAENGGADICAVYAHNDDMAVGAIQAMKDAGLKPGTAPLVVSVDAVPDIFAAMVAGEANATVELTPNMAGPAFDVLDAYLKSGTVPPKFIVTESKLYTPADNPQGEYDSRKGLGY